MDITWKKFTQQLPIVLKEQRKNRNVSHEKLAALSGLTRQAIGKIESGERNPQMVTVYRLVRGLGMTMEEFSQLVEARISAS